MRNLALENQAEDVSILEGTNSKWKLEVKYAFDETAELHKNTSVLQLRAPLTCEDPLAHMLITLSET